MANPSVTPKRLEIPQLAGIHVQDPAVGKAIQSITEYVNANVTPVQGNKVPTRKSAPGGNP